MLFLKSILFFVLMNTAWADEMDLWFKNNLKQNSQSFKSYHWAIRVGKKTKLRVNRDEALRLPEGDAQVDGIEVGQYFRDMSGNFTRKNVQTWAVMDGFYAAFDPLQSISYAGDPWLMVEVDVPAGTNYINLSELGKDIPLSFAYLRKVFPLKSLTKYQGVGTENFNIHDIFTYPNLKKRFLETLKNYKVGFITYQWNKAYFEYCGKRQEAFNFVRPELLDEGASVKVFTGQFSKDSKTISEHQRVAKKLLTVVHESTSQGILAAPKYRGIMKWLSELGMNVQWGHATPADIEELKSESFECGI